MKLRKIYNAITVKIPLESHSHSNWSKIQKLVTGLRESNTHHIIMFSMRLTYFARTSGELSIAALGLADKTVGRLINYISMVAVHAVGNK